MDDRRIIIRRAASGNLAGARHLDELITSAAELLTRFPMIGHRGRIPGTLEYPAHRHYMLIYKATADVVRVLRVVHTSRRWP